MSQSTKHVPVFKRATDDLANHFDSGIIAAVGHILDQIGDLGKRPPLSILGHAAGFVDSPSARSIRVRHHHAGGCFGIQRRDTNEELQGSRFVSK